LTAPPAEFAPPLPAYVAPALEKRFGDWSTMRVELSASRLCFAVTQARSRAARGTAVAEGRTSHVHVASWPQAGVKAEVSVRTGTALRTSVPAQIAIGSEQFALFTKLDGAYVENPIDELKLLEAMKKGSQMTFTAQTEAGSPVSDTFSLSGLAAALAHVTQGCP
jgi:invasion protein IalB